MKRGEIWWALLPKPVGRRPVVLLSRDEAYRLRAYVTIAPVSTRIRRIAAEVLLGPEDGLVRECVVNLDSITTIPKSTLRELVGSLSSQKMAALESALHFALGLSF